MGENQLFFVGQKAFIENDQGEVLVLEDENIGLDLPGGKVQEGETNVVEALKREVREETNLEIEVGEVFHTWIIKYPLNANVTDRRSDGNLYLVGFKCKLLGGDFTMSEEHVGHTWMSKEEFGKIESERGHYQGLKKYFEKYSDA
jgi:8-oxo-dGTP pyrophosphatase MutT (NUDIX family)